jgi:hypothetical protein
VISPFRNHAHKPTNGCFLSAGTISNLFKVSTEKKP